jgi:hypothetical protein
VFWTAGKPVEAKLAMYKKIVERLDANPGVRPEDILINVNETAAENWSFEMARPSSTSPLDGPPDSHRAALAGYPSRPSAQHRKLWSGFGDGLCSAQSDKCLTSRAEYVDPLLDDLPDSRNDCFDQLHDTNSSG